MTERELLALAADRRLVTSEIYEVNAFYGNASIIKDYAGLEQGYPLHAAIEHGFFQDHFAWSVDCQARVPAVFTPAPYRFPVLARSTSKALFAIGPMLLYARSTLDEVALAAMRRRLGRCLLIFPAHSTHRLTTQYDIRELFGITTALRKDFDTVRVCLYWKDIILGRAKPFLDLGYECITAGHMFDPGFLPRLRSFIEAADVCMGNEYSTTLLYSVLLGKPYYLHAMDVRHSAKDQSWVEHDRPDLDATERQLCNVFNSFCDTISNEQRSLVQERVGITHFRTPETMRTLIEIVRDLATDIEPCHERLRLLQTAQRYLAQGRPERALFLVEESILARPGETTLGLFRAVVRHRMELDGNPLAGLLPERTDPLDTPDLTRTGLICDLLEAVFVAIGQGKDAIALNILGKIRTLGCVLRGLGLLESSLRRGLKDERAALGDLARELEAFPDNVEARTLLDAWRQ